MAARIAVAQGEHTIEFDLHKITSDYLIKNIERSFGIWKEIRIIMTFRVKIFLCMYCLTGSITNP